MSSEPPALKQLSPFVIPTDEDVLRSLQESTNDRKNKVSKAENRNKKIHEKETFSSRMQSMLTSVEPLNLPGPGTISEHMSNPTSLPKHVHSSDVCSRGASQEDIAAPIRIRHTETVAEFLSKKREIFLVQMNLDTKRAEICKLEQRALQRESALQRSEEMLEEDALRFDAFLKENDEKLQKALKDAERETRRKQEKIAEIKRLEEESTLLRSEVNKYEEQLEDFQQCKKFLTSVTPKEWSDKQAEKQKNIQEESLEQWRRQCEEIKKRKTEAAANKRRVEEAFQNARTQQEADRAERELGSAIENLKATNLLKDPPKPRFDKSSDEVASAESYFQQPQQLLALLSDLEEKNIFLISHIQEGEEDLEINRAKLAALQNKTDQEIAELEAQVNQVEAELRLKRAFQEKTEDHIIPQNAFSSPDEASESFSEEELNKKLSNAYQLSGFTCDSDTGALSMLTSIEMKLEELLISAKNLPREEIESSERMREKKRRQQQREEKQARLRKEHDERVKRSLERAEAPVFKKTGKPKMFRSVLRKKKPRIIQDNSHDHSIDLQRFLATEF